MACIKRKRERKRREIQRNVFPRRKKKKRQRDRKREKRKQKQTDRHRGKFIVTKIQILCPKGIQIQLFVKMEYYHVLHTFASFIFFSLPSCHQSIFISSPSCLSSSHTVAVCKRNFGAPGWRRDRQCICMYEDSVWSRDKASRSPRSCPHPPLSPPHLHGADLVQQSNVGT